MLRRLRKRKRFVKRHEGMPADFYRADARGLEELRKARGLRVPAVYEVGDDFLAMEDLGQGPRAPDYWQCAAAGLAVQHAVVGARFGFPGNGYCGDTPQDNTPDDDGWHFFAERRLLPQMQRARERGLIDSADVARIEHLCARLPERIPALPAVLLHGDLWSGNLHVCADGRPALVDAGAVHYGWAEAELAMLTLFGSPPDAFFGAYAEHAPLDDAWRQRIPVYNTWHLLNHVNLFGSGYLPALRDALTACV